MRYLERPDLLGQQDEPPIKAKMDLVGLDSNGWFIVGAVSRELKKAGATKEQVDQFRTEAMSGNYDHLLTTAMRWTEPPDGEEGDEE